MQGVGEARTGSLVSLKCKALLFPAAFTAISYLAEFSRGLIFKYTLIYLFKRILKYSKK